MLLLKYSLLFLVCFFSTFLKFHCMLIENSDSSYENLTSTEKIQSQLDSVDLYRTREFNETLLQNLTTSNEKQKQVAVPANKLTILKKRVTTFFQINVIKKYKNEMYGLGYPFRSIAGAVSYSAIADVACPTGYIEHPVTHHCLEQL